MAEGPSKVDINAIFKRLRSIPTNKQCFDCGSLNPTWASVTYGVFLCIDCSAVHRSLGVHLTFIRSTQLDTSWTWLQLRAMQVGGNANATAFFRQHGCSTNDAQQKYNSRAASMYREKLHASASKAMQLHGTKLHVDSSTTASSDPTSPPPGSKEEDFFKEHEEAALSAGDGPTTQPIAVPVSNGSAKQTAPEPIDPTHGPSVDAALSISPTTAQAQAEVRKPTIGGRKPTGAKKGLGARKGGLGAQRVKANFSELESQAQERDKAREQMEANMVAAAKKSKEDEEKQLASMRLAYQDLTVETKKQEAKMKNMDPKKREQVERLGMGFGRSGGVSHSALTDMQTISQETPTSKSSSFDKYSSRNRDFEDDFEIVGGFSSGPPKYDSPFGLKKEDKYSSWGNSSTNNSSSKSSWDAADRFDNKQSLVVEDISHSNKSDDGERGRSRKNYETSSSEEAQKKFGGAKAISSDMFFGKEKESEARHNLSKFEGQSSISSADLFGEGRPTERNYNNYSGSGAGPDLQEIKDGVKQGVTKVAGKLSSLANGVMNSIQDHYG